MPNDAQINFQACLSSLEELQNGPEDAVFSTTYKDHLNLLQTLNTVLSSKVIVTPTDADRVLRICLRYTKDVRCILYVFPIITQLIDIDKDNPIVDFLPFALAVLEFLNARCLENNTSKLQILCLKMLLKHPKSALIKLITGHSSKIENTFQLILELDKAEDLDTKIESFKLLTMLEWLPPNEKTLFMNAGLQLWLTGVIPAMMQIIVAAEDVNKIETCLTYTEMLANEIVLLDYLQSPHLQSLTKYIANPEMFPASIKYLLEKGDEKWHRIWIVLVKLLRNYVTRVCPPYVSPINSMLPIVETAFKQDSEQRVRAFACWNELIETFSHETGSCIEKRIKLLIIPLRLNNAKTEETAMAKLNTWWFFINKFRPKIRNFNKDALIPFLHFMFGKNKAPFQFPASQYSHCLRIKCIEAFGELMGHTDCSCELTNLPPLNASITTILLTDHWKDFVYALKCCILVVAKIYTQDTKGKIRCIWNSFVMRLAAMADNSLRQDMFNDLINIVSELILENEESGDKDLLEILVDDVTLPLWRYKTLKTLIKPKSQSNCPTHRIIKLIMNDQFNDYYNLFSSEDLSRLLQPLISNLLEESISTPEYIIRLLDELLVTNSTLAMWTVLVQKSMNYKLSLETFNKLLIWPFKTVHDSFEVKEAAEAWYTLYNIIHEKLGETDFDTEISKVLTRPVEDSKASNYFVLFALIGVLKHKPDEDKMAKLEALTYEMNDYNDFEQLLTPLVNTIVLMTSNLSDENLAQININCVENILKVIDTESEAIGSKRTTKNRETTFKNLKANIPNKTVLLETITSTLKDYLEKCPYESIKKQVRSLLASYNKTKNTEKVSKSPKKASKSPGKALNKVQEHKKSKKQEPRIITTVVGNGEEYVVVKSNWKFNPKNLTENQKEKFQRKRDIPALYQDLSQSQDEFKLTTWKTDSQDTSLSSSKSTGSNNVSETLNKITNSEIVPNIMENILEIEKNSKTKSDSIAKEKTLKADKLSTPTATKSPRMALKDRVFRNVKNLIENSSASPQEKNTDKQEDSNILQNVSKSPISKPELICLESPAKKAELNEQILKPSNNDVTNKQENGSPVTSHSNVRMKKGMVLSTQRIDQIMKRACTPVSNPQKEIDLQLSALEMSNERPARLKKTPKKFDDSLLLAVKKRRYSKCDSQSYSQDLLEPHNKTVIAQIHNPNDKMNITDANTSQKNSPIEADPKENAKKSLTATDDGITVENVTICAAFDDTSQKDSKKVSLTSPTTKPFDKPVIEKTSPEKLSTGEVPSTLSIDSEGVALSIPALNNTCDVKDKANIEITELQESTVEKVEKEKDLHDIPLKYRKYRKSEDEKEISGDTDKTLVKSPVTDDIDLNKYKLSAEKSILHNDMDKNVEKIEVVSISINKNKIDLNTSLLPSSKTPEPQKSPKEIGALHDAITDYLDTSNIPLIKSKKSEVHEKSCDNDENIALNSPVTAYQDLNQSELSAKKNVLSNDTDKDVKKLEVVPTLLNKNMKDSDNSPIHIIPLPISTSPKLQKRPKTICAQHDEITHSMDPPYILLKKLRNSKPRKNNTTKDENTAVKSPVTTDKDQITLSSKKRVVQNNTDKNVKKVKVVPIPINKTKKDSNTRLLQSAKKRFSLINKNVKKGNEFATEDKKDEDEKDEDNKDEDNKDEDNKNENNKDKYKKDEDKKDEDKKDEDKKDEDEKDEDNKNENNKDKYKKDEENQLITPKRRKMKKSPVERELAIDMVEGHPFLQTQSQKRQTRKKTLEVTNGSKRKTVIDKLNKSKLERTPKTPKKSNKSLQSVNTTIIVDDSQDKAQSVSPHNIMDEPACSEDVIESSQDSTMTTISVKAKKQTSKRIPIIALTKIAVPITITKDVLQDCMTVNKANNDSQNHESTDIELPQNKSVESDKNVIDFIENMDTEPIGDSQYNTDLTENMDTEPLASNESDDVVILSETLTTPVTVNSESEPVIGPETQELAEADTQPNDPKQFEKWEINEPLLTSPNSNLPESVLIEDSTQSLPEAALSLTNIGDTTEVSSPFKDDNQRKQDFLNNTVEISPIKVQSPDREKKSPSPETSKDFVVIQLSSPVHSNGEPFDKQCSPEFFTEDKLSPDKQNASPPRVEVTVTNSSPSASLSLKKHRSQVNRPSSGRAAQMLGLLCVSDLKNKNLPEHEKPKNASISTPAKNQLRSYYEFDYFAEKNGSKEENFLKLQRSLPTVTSSPSGPILKRKLVEITDDSTASPASKRKRVSFHDPPVSTTVSVQKYIEPLSLMRSPQSKKRQTRSGMKAPKRLDSAFLDSALSKTVESFTEATTPSDETENISLDVTPAVEIVKSSELNDTDPICPDLIDCTDPIDVIAIELSSTAMRDLFVKELEGKVDTVGDLAKMTELEVNRLCIKAPKITVAKKVLMDYISNRPAITVETVIEEAFSEPMTESLLQEGCDDGRQADVEIQTDNEVSNKTTQVVVEQVISETQTDLVVSMNASIQTVEDFKTTEEIIDSCLSERGDFLEKLKNKLNDDQVQTIAGLLSAKTMLKLIMNKTDESTTTVMQKILKHQCKGIPKSSKPKEELKYLREFLLERYGIADLALLCSQVLQSLFDEPA